MTTQRDAVLQMHLQTIALEENFVTNAISRMLDILPDFKTKLLESIGFADDQTKICQSLTIDVEKKMSEIENASKQIPFSEFGKIIIPIPENFVGSYNNYLMCLIDLTNEVFKEDLVVLRNYETMLSLFITNKEAKLGSFIKEKQYFKQIGGVKDKVSLTLKTYFPKETGVSIAKCEEVFTRMADIVIMNEKTIELAKLHNNVNVTKVTELARSCTELLDIIIKNIENNVYKDASPEAVSALSEGTYVVAQYIEMIAALYYKNTVAINITNLINEKLLPSKK